MRPKAANAFLATQGEQVLYLFSCYSSSFEHLLHNCEHDFLSLPAVCCKAQLPWWVLVQRCKHQDLLSCTCPFSS